MPVYKINKTVHLDKFTKCYKNIFSINNPPNDVSLNSITKTISREKLSPFQTFSTCCEYPSCLKVFINLNSGELLLEKNIDKFPEMERNSAMAFAYNAMEKYKAKVGAKAEILIYEVKLKPDVILRDQQNSCVGKHHIEEYGEVDGIQEKNGMETVIFNKDKIQSIRLIKKGIQNPNQTSWENEIILK